MTFCHRYMERPGRFFLPDLFHIYLAGFGQDFAASSLVYMLPVTFESTDAHSVEGQLIVLNNAFKLWRKMFKVSTHIATFNRNMLGFPDATKVYPTGTWSKASDAAKIINFILYISELYDHVDDRLLRYIGVASHAIGVCMGNMYASDLWVDSWLCRSSDVFCLTQRWNKGGSSKFCCLRIVLAGFLVPTAHPQEVDTATKIVDAGLTFLKAYAKLASEAHKAGRPLWVYKPKIHYFHHILHDMKAAISKGHKPLNPLAFSCAMAEDFIGRTSLLARRVSAMTTETRVLQRYLLAAFVAWGNSSQT